MHKNQRTSPNGENEENGGDVCFRQKLGVRKV